MSMNISHRRSQEIGPQQNRSAMLKTERQQLALVEAKLDFQMELEEKEIREDPQDNESPEEEETSDSDRVAGDDQSEVAFDQDQVAGLPFLLDLPAKARPIVWYRIDKNFEVHRVAVPEKNTVSHRIARGIACHLEQAGCRLEQRGDWCHIPHLNTGSLFSLSVPKNDRTRATNLWNSRGTKQRREQLLEEIMDEDTKTIFRSLEKLRHPSCDFAVILPNRDVIAVDVLLSEAQKGKRAMRAAALHLSCKDPRPDLVAGDTWTQEDWKRFDAAQRKRKSESNKIRKRQLQPGS